jgi:hypothetical protein
MLRLKLDPAKAVPALISYQYDENADPEGFYEGRTWPTDDGLAYIIWHDCGELDYPFEQVVKIRVETASEVFSPVYTMTRNSEAEVKRFWLERYGYRSAREAGGAHDCP